MNPDTLNSLTDLELSDVITSAQSLIKERAERRKKEAMEQIREIAASAQIAVSFGSGRKPKAVKTVLRTGERYVNPADATQSYVVGKGKPPRWFALLRERGKLPVTVPAVPDVGM